MNTQTIQTKHFQAERMQQRGVPMEFPDLAKLYGEVTSRDATTSCIHFSKKSIYQMKEKGVSKRLILEVEVRKDIRFIVNKITNAFITVEYTYTANRRLKRDTRNYKRIKQLH
jgi:hypothetical protein